MNFLLTNEQRVYLGLPLIEENWECVSLSDEIDAYFDCDVIRKVIKRREDYYEETTIEEVTRNDRTILAPKTNRGKEQKLTIANLDKRTGLGTYFVFGSGYVKIGNYSTQTTYYDSDMAGVACNGFADLEKWVKDWIEQTDQQRLKEIQAFSTAKKKHCKYREGDYFVFKFDRGVFGYGRILLDYNRLRDEKIKFWDILMGKPLVIKIYHIISESESLLPSDIKKLPSVPAQFIFDNRFYYGEYKIIGNEPLAQDELDYPIMYGRGIDSGDKNKIIFQHGLVYRCLDGKNNKFYGNFRNSAIGWSLDINRKIIEECISTKSNQPYWDQIRAYQKDDLRNPKYDEVREEIFKQFNIGSTEIGSSSKKWSLKNLFKK